MRRERKEVRVRSKPYSLDETGTAGPFIYFTSSRSCTELYCGKCAPPYDIREVDGAKVLYYRNHPAQKIEVSEKGEDIKAKGSH
jgi:hypothetical protein